MDRNHRRLPVDAHLVGADAARAARAQRRQQALEAFVTAPEPVSVENYLHELAYIDGDAAAHTIEPNIA